MQISQANEPCWRIVDLGLMEVNSYLINFQSGKNTCIDIPLK